MPFGIGAGNHRRPGSFPGVGRKCVGRPLFFTVAATLVWNVNVSSVRSRVLAPSMNTDSYSPLRQDKTHSTLLTYHHQANLMKCVLSLTYAVPVEAGFTPTPLHDRSMRITKLDGICFSLEWGQFNVS